MGKKASGGKKSRSRSVGGAKAKAGKAIGAAKGFFGAGKTKSELAKHRRKHGVNWWANRVLVEKLKKKYNRIKYGSMR